MEMLLEQFKIIFDRPEKVKRLRDLILQLAVRGKLVEQDENDEPASVLLERIKEEREKLIKEGKIKKSKPLPEISEDEKPYELPRGWEWVRLGKLIRITSGKNLTKSKMNEEGNIPVYGGNGVTGYHDNFNVKEETIVIGRVGFYCGSIHLTEKKAWVTDNAFITEYPQNYIYREFLIWLLKGTNLKEEENATAQPVISGRKIYPIVIGIPPLNEQKRIVEKVDLLMDFCDNLEKELQRKIKYNSLSSKSVFNSISSCNSLDELEETLRFIIDNFKELTLGDNGVKELKSAVLQLAVQGKLVPQNPKDEPASVLLKKIKEEKERLIREGKIKKEKPLSEIREEEKKCELPIGWSYVRFAELIESMNNGIYKHESFFNPLGVICLRMYNIFEGSIVLKDLVRIMLTEEELNIYKLIKGDLLLNRVNSRELVGKTAVIDEYTEDMIYESKNIRIRLMEKSILPIYLNYYLQSDGVRNIFSGDAKKTCGQASINQQQIRNLVVELPPLSEQKRIVEKVDSLMALCDELEKRIEESKKYSEKLMEALLKNEFM
ncbi:restriction endonuclease subunit S [Clostridium coskatii]|uniref:Type-1 restriction enzyme EcoKI specificity protein n=1 Tax=Clostridium coskatii TaxID=1705578 RepID=A0A162LAQ9_9CLOT|nr:restriction endonuclease subunit S [Clostridium coskatii]OAA93552.1 Type-1 restriction enzyme EcoKI specificity protein [Clostridium coskatii]OBR96341.1 type-1 restriction enzyme EcoKI specificity protein [Clostridium coskatii]